MKKKNLIFIILIIVFVFGIVIKTFQNDVFFSIAVGRNILQNGVQKIDTLTFHENLEFTNARWVFDVIIASLNEYFGFAGIYAFAIVLSIIIGCSFFVLLEKRGINSTVSFISTIAVLYIGSGYLVARAQIVSLLIFVLESYCLEKLIETNSKKYSIFLLILSIALANIHASIYLTFFIFFLPYIAEFILYKLPFVKNEGIKFKINENINIKYLLITMIVCLLGGFITPLGLVPFTSMYKEATGIATSVIAEMQPISLNTSLLFLALNLIFIFTAIFRKEKIYLSDVFLIIGLDCLAISTNRAQMYFIFVGSIAIIKNFNELLNEYDVKLDFSKISKTVNIIFIICFVVFSGRCFSEKILSDYADTTTYPVEECKYILNNLDIENMRIYNSLNIGSYLEYLGIKTFIDSRNGMFTEDFNEGCTVLEDFIGVAYGTSHYNELFEEYEITHALVKEGEILNTYLSEDENWKLLYYGDAFSLYEKIK